MKKNINSLLVKEVCVTIHSLSKKQRSFPNLLIVRFFVSLQPFYQILMLLVEVSNLLAVVFQQLPGRAEEGQALVDGRERSRVLLVLRLRTSVSG